MELYHGSNENVERPRILEKQRLLDFGKGFYVTSSREQAERWAKIKQKRTGVPASAVVNVYLASNNLLIDPLLKSKVFHEASEAWLDFIILNRNSDLNPEYDLVFGPVANDTLYQTFSLYEAGILTKPETIARLKVHKLFDQYAFNTNAALEFLKFSHSYEV